jgi:general secretion pathway protein C
MPRIVFLVLQLILLAGVVLVSASIVRKQTTVHDALTAKPPASDRPQPNQTPPERTKPFAHYQVIARRDLFKTPQNAELAKAAIDIETLKPTALKLKLWGTITGQDGMTRAVIEDQTKRKQAFYRAGEEVSSAQIKMILREKVILSVKGEDQILEIEKPSSTNRPAPPRRVAPHRDGRSEQGRPPTARAQKAASRRAVRLKLSRLGPISENPEDWQSYANAAPYKGGDGETGLMLNQITPSSPFRRLGIRNGDIILGINDQPVDNLEAILQSLAAISAGDELSLKIKRRGRERKLDFQFE